MLFNRFHILDELGVGAYGRVLRCYDSQTGTVVALKELRRLGPDVLLRFKNEFRALCDLRHDHLVRLGELLEADGSWGFTMEVVEGTDVISWVRAPDRPTGFHEERLRRVLLDLTCGLSALHGFGFVHCDVKPQNARVNPEGRAILLDFGMVTMLGSKVAEERAVGGTIAYMAPEQLEGDEPAPALDCYALGVVAYEAMTGELPFVGTRSDVLRNKRVGALRRPSELVPGIPQDLEEVCLRLMEPEPCRRLDIRGVVGLLSRSASVAAVPAGPAAARALPEAEMFVGRERELGALDRHLEQALAYHPTLAVVEGESGMGKTALVNRFVERVRERYPDAWVLSGRCHPNEQIAFKAFDGVIDQLSRALLRCEPRELKDLLPRGRHLLPALFPVLARVELMRDEQPSGASERIERFPVFRAFAELLLHVSRRRLLVLAIDDWQWSDQESSLLLRAIFELLSHARLLVVVTFRPLADVRDEVEQRLVALVRSQQAGRLPLTGLTDEDAWTLYRRLCGQADPSLHVHSVVRATGGHPLFLTELARERVRGVSVPAHAFDEQVRRRLALLPRVEKRLLEVMAVAGSPLSRRILSGAGGLTPDEIALAIPRLRGERWVTAVRHGEFVVYHDRIREILEAGLGSEQRRALHRALALSHEREARPDPAAIAQHWLASDQPELSRGWLERAAVLATETAAFERAAEYYAQRLSLDAEACREPEHFHALRVLYAESLASAGRPQDAARYLQQALDKTRAEDRPELFVHAAQYLLQAGEIDSGVLAAKQAMAAVGLAWPAHRLSVALRYLGHRAAIAVRGSHIGRSEVPVREAAELELDTLWRLCQPMLWADLLRSSEIAARHLRAAVRNASPKHVALAFCQEALLQTMQSPRSDRGEQALREAEHWVAKADSPYLRGYHAFVRGSVATFAWDIAAARAHLERAEKIYREECPAEPWMLASTRGPLLNALLNHGAHGVFAEKAEAWIAEAGLRGDAFARASYVVTGLGSWRHLMRDAPERALIEIDEAMRPWRHATTGFQHFMEALSVHFALAYRGRGEAHEHWKTAWPRLARSVLMGIGFMSDWLKLARVDAALEAAVNAPSAPSSPARFAQANEVAKSLRHVATPLGRAYAELFRAQLAACAGRASEARGCAWRAHEAFCARGGVHGRFAALLLTWADDPEQAPLHEAALHDWLGSEGWRDPIRALRLWLPAWPYLRSRR